jgi:hypothetical protein
MAPEYGATMGFFPIDAECVNYLRATGRSEEHSRLRKLLQGAGPVGHSEEGRDRLLAGARTRPRTVVPSVAGPKRPQDRIELPNLKKAICAVQQAVTENGFGKNAADWASVPVTERPLSHPGGGSRPAPIGAAAQRAATEREMATTSHARPRSPARAAKARLARSPRLRAHRRHHELHEHQQPERHARRRFAGEEGRRKRASR